MNKFHAAVLITFVALAGCASVNGRGLVGGQSTAQDVEALMGRPAEKLKAADGDTIWFYPHQPFGRQIFAARIAPDGRMRSVEQTLTEDNLRKMVPGSTTRAAAREVFGPPFQTSTNARMQREVWEYAMYNTQQWDFFLYLQFSPDGLLQEAYMLKDYHKELGDSFNG